MDKKHIPRIHDLLGDDDGAAMLEFVILAPLLSYLLIAIFFFHHHIDYAQDAVVRFRHLTWKHAPPGGIGHRLRAIPTKTASPPCCLSAGTVQVAPGARRRIRALNLGGALAGERYFGGSAFRPPTAA